MARTRFAVPEPTSCAAPATAARCVRLDLYSSSLLPGGRRQASSVRRRGSTKGSQTVVDSLTRLAALPHSEGCSDLEILLLERSLGFTLPATYRAFLRIVGKGSGEFLDGSVFHLSEIPRLQEAARELLDEAGRPWALEAEDFVFLMHQGYEFLFLRRDGSEDPPVYLYEELEAAPRLWARSFSDWIHAAVDEVTSQDTGV